MCKSELMNESALWDKIGGLASGPTVGRPVQILSH